MKPVKQPVAQSDSAGPAGRSQLPRAELTGGKDCEHHTAVEFSHGRRLLPARASRGRLQLRQYLRALPRRPRRALLPTDLAAQRAGAQALARDAQERGWVDEAERHQKLIARLDALIAKTGANTA